MYTPILATLGYILSPDKQHTLMIHRNKRKDDQHLGKYNGLGGKMLPGEDIQTCLIRELYEEAGVRCEKTVLRGTINWTGFGPDGENWFGFIYLVTRFSGKLFSENEEGDLKWVAIKDIMTLPMWEGDKYFLPLVFDENPRVFHGYMPYDGGRPLSWNFTRS